MIDVWNACEQRPRPLLSKSFLITPASTGHYMQGQYANDHDNAGKNMHTLEGNKHAKTQFKNAETQSCDVCIV